MSGSAAARVLLAAATVVLGVAAVALASGGSAGPGPNTASERRATDAWAALRPSPLRRTEVGSALVGDRIYVVGGFVPEGGATGRLARYDISADRWKLLEPMPIAVHHPGVTALHGRVWVHGGVRTGLPGPPAPTARLYSYDPGEDRWRRHRSGRVARFAQAFEPLGGKLYSAGGANAGGDLRSVEVYDPRGNRWRRAPGLPTARNHVGSAALRGRLYVIAGRADGANLDVVERYDPERGRWTETAPIEVPRSGFRAISHGGGIVAFGGEELGGGETIGEVEMYDPARDGWSRLPPMTTPRHGLGGVVYEGRVYAVEGGPQPGLAFSGANEYLDLP
jgi:N-acetylneuraminic acid mutarotase